ncbi:bifunctional metallophosphatase/5'-nucleotidase [Egibacter rhizosphaerae]|uniref:Bifunctional metallophosphatase/5'-nucleotidase n=1 Tax=Egibacter rhizosphaerae TaxID=1670831 RepID=A0A411YF26_9ACTN|nr:5'-nucleotidase C-terminal domain-containing protein [Egibacter rhizosphaerae]QBI19864.1 bifunctional metallophosphatase/5'-nucleotidase [Egibacter rhizosphaerae]
MSKTHPPRTTRDHRRPTMVLIGAIAAMMLLAAPTVGASPGPPEHAGGPPDHAVGPPDGVPPGPPDGVPPGPPDGVDPPGHDVDVTILHDTHLHGSFGDADEPNLATYSTLVEERKEANDHAIFVGNGDEIAPSVMSSVFRGQHMIDALNESPLDVTTLGNHEFDYGPDNARDLLADSEFPWVTANVRDPETGDVFGAELGVEPYILEEMGEVTVGVTGLGPEGMATITSLNGEAEQIDANEALDEVVPQMEADGADVIVVASHLCGSDARDVADARDDIHAMVGDHCSEVLDEPEERNGTLVSFVGDEYDHLGELTLSVNPSTGEVRGHDFTRHDLEELDLEPHPEVQAVIDHYEEQLDEALGEVIGERTVEWDTRTDVVRNEETGIGNFIADSMREYHDTDIAVQNSGGIRSDELYEPGDITRLDVVEILPFDNYVVSAEIPGDIIEEMLEHSVSAIDTGDGRFLQVSGIEMTFDGSAPEGERVTEFTVNGEPVDEDATYTIATNDFTLGGGDAYEMLAEEAEVIVDADGGPLLSQFMMDTIEDRDGEPVDTGVEGRIERLDD